jgi:hypothetical protein
VGTAKHKFGRRISAISIVNPFFLFTGTPPSVIKKRQLFWELPSLKWHSLTLLSPLPIYKQIFRGQFDYIARPALCKDFFKVIGVKVYRFFSSKTSRLDCTSFACK